jgi:ABC-type sugar transport system ATPase subunit
MYRFTRILVANYKRIKNVRNHVEFVPKKANYFIMGSTGVALLNFLGLKSKEQTETEEEELIMTIKRGVLSTQRSEFQKAEQLYHLVSSN